MDQLNYAQVRAGPKLPTDGTFFCMNLNLKHSHFIEFDKLGKVIKWHNFYNPPPVSSSWLNYCTSCKS